MLKLGYKASAEQFAPRELVEFGVHAEACGLDSVWISDHFQPWRHTGGHAPFSLSWLAAVGEPNAAGRAGHERADPDVSLSPVSCGACVRHARLPVPRPCGARQRQWRGHERSRPHGHGVARLQGTLRAPAGGGHPDAQAVVRGIRHPHGHLLQDAGRDPVRPSGGWRATVHRRGRPAGGEVRWARGRRLHLHQWQRGRAVPRSTLLPALADGAREAGRDPNTLDRLIEIKVSTTPIGSGRWTTRATGAHWRCRPKKRPASKTRATWNGWPMPCPWSGPLAAGSSRLTPMSASSRSSSTPTSASITWSSTSRALTSGGPWIFSATGSSRGFAS